MKKLLAVLCWSLIWFLVFLRSAQAFAKTQLKASITVAHASIHAGKPIKIHFSLQNKSSQTVCVLKWHTPLEGIYNNIFHTTVNGQEVIYTGIAASRGKPVPTSYVILKPGQEAHADVDLAKSYDFSITASYVIQLHTRIHDATVATASCASAQLVGRDLVSNAVTVQVTGGQSGPIKKVERDQQLRRLPKLGSPQNSSPIFNNCDSSQRQDLALILPTAAVYSSLSCIYLANCGVTDPAGIYSTWFGAQTSRRLAIVQGNFIAINNVIGNKSIEFVCSPPQCEPDLNAFVFPYFPYHIYICPGFWDQPASGPESQPSIIVHEISHFTIVAGTEDFANGKAACIALALENPDDAVMNGDSYELFATSASDCSAVQSHTLKDTVGGNDVKQFLRRLSCNRTTNISRTFHGLLWPPADPDPGNTGKWSPAVHGRGFL